ncbi:monocarboxylate transporter 3-like isoform X2 [Pomacea canaliculata]|nr:monocarboxylate transporter 3-like isoform X2 [Pomacea canaliculata]
MLGSLLIAFGLLTASFASDLVSLILFYGVVAGTGSGLAYTPSVTFIAVYFVRYRVIVNGLILAAPGIGVLAGPYLLRWLIETQGWRLALAACGALMLHMCVLSALLFTPPGEGSSASCTCIRKKDIAKGQLVKVDMLLTRDPNLESRTNWKMSELGSVLLTDSVVWTVEKPSKDETMSLMQRLTNLLRLRFMWIMCLNQFLLYAGYSVNSILFPSYAQSVGVAFSDLPALYTVYGTTMIVSRVTAGFVFNLLPQHHVTIYLVLQLCVALVLLLLPLYGLNLQLLFFAQFLIGLTYGPVFLLVTPMLISQVGMDNLPVAFGTLMLCCGVGYIIAPPIGGLMYDIFGDYKVSYHIAGSTIALAALSVIPLLFLKVDDKKKDEKFNETTLLSPSDADAESDGLVTKHSNGSASSFLTGKTSNPSLLSTAPPVSELTETWELESASSFREV